MSKAAQNMMGKLLSIDLKPKGIPVANIHPGFIKTSMTEKFSEMYEKYGAIEPSKAAPGIIEAVKRATLENTGKFVAPQGTASLGFGLEGLENPESVGPFDELPW
jgi:NAD(P)-dependent dehydrogenase (short-subunit alcohol dehydrogenase family)